MKLNQLLEFLNLSDKDGLFSNVDLSDSKTDFLPNRLQDSLLKINPDYFFCINNEPLILFFDNPENLEELQKQIWNFNQSPAIFLNNGIEWVVKNGFKLLDNKKDLETIVSSNNISDFEYFELITGKTWEKYKNYFEQNNRVDYYLLNNIEHVRTVLTDQKQGNLNSKVANYLIGRVIFIRYLIDRKVELNTYGITKKEDFYEILDDKEKAYNFFQQVKDDFNGNLFPLKYKIDNVEILEKDKIENFHLLKIKELLQGGKVYEDGSYQPSFFDIYDFSIIPIEFISNVYEKFIGVEKQAGTGAYYTPLFLVDYIQKETVSKYFKTNSTEYNCKVLDPACGSGIFLVETLRQIISQYQKNNPEYLEEDNYEEYKDTLKQLLTNNIFGVDKDENAISVAIFSLYITLLDNLRPRSIVGFRFPELIGTNFFANDFFDIKEPFDTELKKHHFQFILGNPPWATKHPKEKQLFEKYIENRKKTENSNLEIVHREIAEAFIVRVDDLSFNETAFIVVSKILYKLEKKGIFRNYFLNKFSIRQVFELSSVRHHIFDKSNDKAIAPPAILFYSKEKNIKLLRKNIIKHISLKPNIFFETFKLMVVEKSDIKEFAQQFFIDEDWIWKVLVYGNILDYHFIKRLKKDYDSIGLIATKKGFIKKRGLQRTTNKKNIDVSDLKGLPFIDTKKKELKKYYIYSTKKWDESFVAICPPKEIFKAPLLLSTKGVDSSFNMKSAISYQDVVFTDSLLALKAKDISEIDTLRSISAIWNSSITTAYITLTASSIGIEREQLHIEEKLNVPFATNDALQNLYVETESLSNLYYSNYMANDSVNNDFENNVKNIDDELISLFKISNQEKSLINYTNNITIPLLKGNDAQSKKVISKLKYKSEVLNEYAKIFIDHFSKRFNSNGHFFEIEIIFSNHTILMKFKIISQLSKYTNCIQWSKDGDKNLLITLTKLGFENLSDNLYLQKDIKGLEQDYFYVAKPNQYKSWHPALAYLDLSEFIEAFFKIDNEKM